MFTPRQRCARAIRSFRSLFAPGQVRQCPRPAGRGHPCNYGPTGATKATNRYIALLRVCMAGTYAEPWKDVTASTRQDACITMRRDAGLLPATQPPQIQLRFAILPGYSTSARLVGTVSS